MVKVLILAGGRGTRLSAVVPDRPKPMADISGQPFLSYQMDYLIAQDIQEVILSVGYKAECIQDFYQNSYKNLKISYAHEVNPLGTGGAILNGLKINNQNSENNFLILNGDTFFDLNILDFKNFFEKSKADIAVGLAYVPDTGRYGKVFLEENSDQVLSFGEKKSAGPGWINAGVYLLGPKVLEILKNLNQESFSWESEILSRAGDLGLKIFGFKSNNTHFIDIGIPEDYERAQRALPALVNSALSPNPSPISWKSELTNSALYLNPFPSVSGDSFALSPNPSPTCGRGAKSPLPPAGEVEQLLLGRGLSAGEKSELGRGLSLGEKSERGRVVSRGDKKGG